MNRKQRRRQLARRQAHALYVDRPRRTMSRASYPVVKQGHIVPVVYQRNFAVGGRVTLHVDDRDGVPAKIRNTATRGPFYRRERPDGTEIDDTEASLSYIEGAVAPVFRDLLADEPLTRERKQVLAQFFGIQMVRGPAFVEQRAELVSEMISGLEAKDLKPRLLREVDGDLCCAGTGPRQVPRGDAARGHDAHDVAQARRGDRQHALAAAEVRRAAARLLRSPGGGVADERDPNRAVREAALGPAHRHRGARAGVAAARTADDLGGGAGRPGAGVGEAAARCRAERLHYRAGRPPVDARAGFHAAHASGAMAPLSREFETAYSVQRAEASMRRAAAEKYLHRVRNKRFLSDIEIVEITLKSPGVSAAR